LFIIKRKSDCAYDEFIAALKETGQSHVIYILTNGKEGKHPLSDEDIQALAQNRYQLLEVVDPFISGLADKLVSNGSFSSTDLQREIEAGDTTNIIRAMLEKLERKPQEAFNSFINALKETGQEHVSNLFRSKLTVNVELESNVSSQSVQRTDGDRAEDAVVTVLRSESCAIRNEISENFCDVVVVKNCIKILFCNLTLESFDRLQQLLESGRLQAMLNEMCKQVLNEHGFDSLLLRVDQSEFVRIKQEFKGCELMTNSHRKILKSAVDKIGDLVNISETLLNKLDLCVRRRSAIMSNESSSEKVKLLLEITSRRPDSAFKKLIDALKASGQHQAADILEAESNNSSSIDTFDRKSNSDQFVSNHLRSTQSLDKQTSRQEYGADSTRQRAETDTTSALTTTQNAG
jgi:hypothetical protein